MPSASYMQAREKIRAAKEEAQELAKQAFQDEAFALVEDMGIDSFSWTQYTPYFNDGDACVFRVHTDYPSVNGLDAEPPGSPDAAKFGGYNNEWREAYRAWSKTLPRTKIAEFLGQWDEEDMLFMFGDHAKVTVYADKIEVDEYNHD